MTIGYAIYGLDNDSYMTGDNTPKCDKCGFRTDYRHNNVHFKLTRKTNELSYTYDGIVIVNLKLKEFCERWGYSNLKFIELEKSFGFFQMYVSNNVLPYKAELMDKFCDKCGQYEEVIGPSIDEQKVGSPLDDNFYQSDLWFGSGDGKSPVMIIGQQTKDKLVKENFKNLVFKPIEV